MIRGVVLAALLLLAPSLAFAQATQIVVTQGTFSDPCFASMKSNAPFGTAGSSNIQTVAGVSGQKVYICSLILFTGTPAIVDLVEGPGSSCGVPSNGTAISGMSFVTNEGVTLGNGGSVIAQTASAGNGVCAITSGTSAQIGGSMTYVQK